MPSIASVTAWLRECTREFADRADELNDLDAILGDGDHGTNMYRGFAAAAALDLTTATDANDALRQVGMTLVSTVGGASGPLFGTLLLRAGAAWPKRVNLGGLALALRAGTDGVQARGKAERGDKTMVDALLGTLDAMESDDRQGIPLLEALPHIVGATQEAAAQTAPLVASRGRAALRADQSVGVMDPGAVSTAIILKTCASFLEADLRSRG